MARCSNLDLKLLPAEMYFDKRFTKLRLLDLSSNALNGLTEATPVSGRGLVVADVVLQDAMKQMKELEELNLSDNLIREIPQQLPRLLPALVSRPNHGCRTVRCVRVEMRLDISKCMIESLPPDINALSRLQVKQHLEAASQQFGATPDKSLVTPR